LLSRKQKSILAALSVRVGSIEDNCFGGWHGYRAAKAVLNMIIRTLLMEFLRLNPCALCVGLHPGTVDMALTTPYQNLISEDGLFPTKQSARHLNNGAYWPASREYWPGIHLGWLAGSLSDNYGHAECPGYD
jgi:NAD(P)-dependent dehydrogenase (short-subunit alcohol dehydrogenase family)